MYLARHTIVFFPNHARIQDARGRVERIHRRIDPELCDLARENGGRIEMSEGSCRGRVGQIVRRDIDRLDRGNRSLAGCGNPFLQLAQIGGQSRLIAHG